MCINKLVQNKTEFDCIPLTDHMEVIVLDSFEALSTNGARLESDV